MSSSWPPELKAWVQECLAKATTANKPAVNAELKQILFQAHKDGTVQSTDWSKVELKALQQQAHRTHIQPTYTQPVFAPAPVYVADPPPANYLSSTHVPAKKKKQKRQNDAAAASTSSFPSAYTFDSPDEAEAKARRLARFQKDARATSNGSPGPVATGVSVWFPDEKENGGLGSRIAGFGPSLAGRANKRLKLKKSALGVGYAEAEEENTAINWDAHTIKGTSLKLEKNYLRLTSEPNPAEVRPPEVLEQTLQLLKRKWKENHNYAYALDQFKSMRQDLTVQRIKTDFTVEVYEIHARIALEAKDLGEYNQCQSQLRQLYELGLKGHPEEFLSYRIMYLLHTRNRSDMAALLGQLTDKEKEDPGVHHALQTAAALATSNYVRFFRLFVNAPNMSGYIMDHFVDRERAQALAVMSKAYLTLPITYLTSTLAFDSDEDTDEYLTDHHANIYTNATPPQPARDPSNPWKPVARGPPIPLSQWIWDCKKAHPACAQSTDKYRVVDLKGQVD